MKLNFHFVFLYCGSIIITSKQKKFKCTKVILLNLPFLICIQVIADIEFKCFSNSYYLTVITSSVPTKLVYNFSNFASAAFAAIDLFGFTKPCKKKRKKIKAICIYNILQVILCIERFCFLFHRLIIKSWIIPHIISKNTN